MTVPSPFMRWLWPAPSAEPSLESWRSALTAYTLRVVMVGAGMTLALVWLSFSPGAPPATFWRVAAFYPLTLVMLAFARHSAHARAAFMLSMFLGVAPILFASVGPNVSAFLSLLMACVLAAVLIGPRAATAFLAISVLLLVLGALAHLNGWGSPELRDPLALAGEPSVWFRTGLVWFTFTGWVVFVTCWLTSRIDAALRAKLLAMAAAEAEGVRRLASDQQRIATQSALIEAQKHEAMGRIAGGVWHDFNNALFVILGWNDLLSQGEVSAEQRRQGHAAIASAGGNAAALARRLVTKSHEHTARPHLTLLKPLVEEGVRHLARLLPDDIRVDSELLDVPPVSIDASHVQQVLLNLALTARDAMPNGGHLTFTLRLGDAAVSGASNGARWVEICAHDTGHGMDEAARAHLFEPDANGGRGGGGAVPALAATQAIVERAGGRIVVESAPGRGTLFRILLPAGESAAAPAPASATTVPSAARAQREAAVLVVEDDPGVRELIVIALRSRGHHVREAADGDQAMRLLEDPDAREDLLCIDGVLPGAPATAIIERFRFMRPGCPVLVCSGNVGTPQLQALVQDERLPFLAKPFTPAELAAKVDELLLRRPVVANRA